MSIGPLNRRSSGLPSLWRALLELLVACRWVWAAMVAGRISRGGGWSCQHYALQSRHELPQIQKAWIWGICCTGLLTFSKPDLTVCVRACMKMNMASCFPKPFYQEANIFSPEEQSLYSYKLSRAVQTQTVSLPEQQNLATSTSQCLLAVILETAPPHTASRLSGACVKLHPKRIEPQPLL